MKWEIEIMETYFSTPDSNLFPTRFILKYLEFFIVFVPSSLGVCAELGKRKIRI